MSKEEALQSLLKGIWFCGLIGHCGKKAVIYKGLIFTSPVLNEVLDQ